MLRINKARIIVSGKRSVRPQNVYGSMRYLHQQSFEEKLLSEPAFQVAMCSPLIFLSQMKLALLQFCCKFLV